MTGAEALRARMTPVPEGKWLVGFSGGADSLALLYLLLPQAREGRIRLEAVHVDHGIRGREAEEDACFCREICGREGIPFHLYRLQPEGRLDEGTARTGRYAAFRRCAAETGAEGVILAHQMEDQAETFMMRLMRGAGPEGLACMEADTRQGGLRILRPLLGISGKDLRRMLREMDLSWREDRTNRDPAYLRNAVRLQLMPEMERLSPGCGERLARTAALLGEENRAMNREADAWLRERSGEDWLDAEALKSRPPALQRRILRRWWNTWGPERKERGLDAAQTEALRELLDRDGGSVNLPGGLKGVRGRRFLHLTGKPAIRRDPVPVEEERTEFGPWALEKRPAEGNPGDGKQSQEVPEGFTEGCVIRTRRPGDRIRPFGMNHHRKLQDYLTDRGVEAPWRDRIPLLCRGDEVLLVAGVGAGNVPRLKDTEKRVRLRWDGEMPWAREATGRKG